MRCKNKENAAPLSRKFSGPEGDFSALPVVSACAPVSKHLGIKGTFPVCWYLVLMTYSENFQKQNGLATKQQWNDFQEIFKIFYDKAIG